MATMKRILLLLFVLLSVAPAYAAESYDGTGDKHTVNNINSPDVDTFSVCFWIYNTAFEDSGAIFSYGNGRNSSAGRGWSLVTKTDGGVRFDAYDGAGGFTDVLSPTMSTSTWHHVCFVRESLFAHKLYIDATDATADATIAVDPGAAQSSTDDFIVGGPIGQDSNGHINLSATLVHVGYWTVALTGSEVASLADKTVCPTALQAASLEVFLRLDVTPEVDTSANAFSVSETGNPTITSDPSGLPCGAAASTKFPVFKAIGAL